MAAPDEWLHFLAPHLRLEVRCLWLAGSCSSASLSKKAPVQEVQALSQTCRALRAAVRALPDAVWRQCRERTLPSCHPLSSARDTPAAADRLWRGCQALTRQARKAGSVHLHQPRKGAYLQVRDPLSRHKPAASTALQVCSRTARRNTAVKRRAKHCWQPQSLTS